MNFSFPKSEKLKSATTIKKLFEEGKTHTKFPLKVLFITQEDSAVTQATFAVPKRNFKKAVTRNRIKRQLREAYRLNKHSLSTNNGKKFALLFLYLGKDRPQYATLNTSMARLVKKLNEEFEEVKT